jgi:hypothetical protein
MVSNRQSRTIADLERTVRAIATEFKTDSVFIIGSQAILVGWPEAPLAAKFDLYGTIAIPKSTASFARVSTVNLNTSGRL